MLHKNCPFLDYGFLDDTLFYIPIHFVVLKQVQRTIYTNCAQVYLWAVYDLRIFVFIWRNFTAMLCTLVLAYLVSTSLNIDTTQIDDSFQTTISQIEAHKITNIDEEASRDSFQPPRTNRLSPLLFTATKQTTPIYLLVIAFLELEITAGLYKDLANPPVLKPWYEQLTHNNQSSRICAWKDGNFMYSSRNTYHS